MFQIHYKRPNNTYGFKRFMTELEARNFAVFAAIDLNFSCITMKESKINYDILDRSINARIAKKRKHERTIEELFNPNMCR